MRHRFKKFLVDELRIIRGALRFLDTALIGSDNGVTRCHKFVLAAFTPFLKATISSVGDGDTDEPCTILFPDFSQRTLDNFTALVYGELLPRELSRSELTDVSGLCQVLQLPTEYENQDAEDTNGGHLPGVQEVESQMACDDSTFEEREDKGSSATNDQSSRGHDWAGAGDKKKTRRKRSKIECAKCGKMVGGLSAMLNHIKACRGLDSSSLECHLCGRVFERKDVLSTHLMRHGGRRLHCQHCPKLFRARPDLNRHVRRVHGEGAVGNRVGVNCNVCGKRFVSAHSQALVDHLAKHRGVRNYWCEVRSLNYDCCYASFTRLLHSCTTFISVGLRFGLFFPHGSVRAQRQALLYDESRV